MSKEIKNIESITVTDLLAMFAYGRFATVKFVKKEDGSVRTLNGKTKVNSAINGRGASYDAFSRGQLRVCDVNLKDANGVRYSGYRTVTASNVLEVSANKTIYKVIEPQPKSSFITKINYVGGHLILTINNHRVYRYLNVPKDIAMRFYKATSRGTFYNDVIKKRYVCEIIH